MKNPFQQSPQEDRKLFQAKGFQRVQPPRDERRLWLPDKDCERLNRSERSALMALLTVENYMKDCKEDLGKRLDAIPSGKSRMNMALGGIKAILDDIIGTIPAAQSRQIANVMNDMEVRITPKLAPMSTNVILERDIAMALTDMARWRCTDCVEDGRSCKQCALYQIMEATTPLSEYDPSELTCPYATADWEK